MNELSPERKIYLKTIKKQKIKVTATRLSVLFAFIGLWELFSSLGIIDPFIMSSPSRIITCIYSLAVDGSLLLHAGTTFLETISGFILGTVIGSIIAVFLWWSEFAEKIAEPYLVVLNALPKAALGPVIIVWAGAGEGSIIIMALAISLIVAIIEVLNAFRSTDEEKILLLKTMGATKKQIFFKTVLPSNIKSLISSLKVNMGLSWVGVIMGEFLVSKAGLGYLITYGSQVFQMDLVMSSVLLLAIMATAMYELISLIERCIVNKIKL